MMLKLFVVRFLINLLVCVILVLCGTIIYVLFNFSLSKLEPNFNTITRYRSFNVFMKKIKKMSTGEESLINGLTYDNEVNKQMEILFYEFVPYVSIVCFNLLVPLLFNYLVQFEQYSPLFVIKMNLFRTIGLRLSSLAVLISRFYYLVRLSIAQMICFLWHLKLIMNIFRWAKSTRTETLSATTKPTALLSAGRLLSGNSSTNSS